jgi:hypothetical protein
MRDGSPWVAQVFERDCKFERFQDALKAITRREPELDAMAPDQAFATLREVVRAARLALEQ